MKELIIGSTAKKEMKVTPDKLARAVGSGDVEVLATPMVVALMENAAAELAQRGLEDCYTTVGTRISIDHTAPTAEGMTLTAEAVLTEIEGRIYRFAVRAWDEKGIVSQGTHERASVKRESFQKKALERKEAPEERL